MAYFKPPTQILIEPSSHEKSAHACFPGNHRARIESETLENHGKNDGQTTRGRKMIGAAPMGDAGEGEQGAPQLHLGPPVARKSGLD